MASLNKKNKAKNSYIIDGGEKNKTDKMKYIYYFTKARRHKLKNDMRKEYLEDIYDDTKEMENV